MHHNPLITGKIGRFAHQVTANRERRARGDTHPAHRTFSWVVKAVYDANTITYDVFLIFYQRIRRQAPGAVTDTHRAARRMKPQPHFDRRRDGIVKPRTIRKKVEVIRA